MKYKETMDHAIRRAVNYAQYYGVVTLVVLRYGGTVYDVYGGFTCYLDPADEIIWTEVP